MNRTNIIGDHRFLSALLVIMWVFSSCSRNSKATASDIIYAITQPITPDSSHVEKEIPVLCYHQVRDWENTDSKSNRVYIIPVAAFKEHIKLLHDSGFHVILPDQLIAYRQAGKKLPEKPVVLTFDDGTISQYEHALPELNKYGFKAVFFIMTVTLNKRSYMSDAQVKELVGKGHVIGCHTWDHHNVIQYRDTDWENQVEKPLSRLQHITGEPITYFAYPYGAWDQNAISKLKSYGFVGAFQLWGKTDDKDPMFTIKRILVNGSWSAAQLNNTIKNYYHY